MKICSKCGENKTLLSFPKHKNSTGGYRNYCKSCKAKQDSDARIERLSKPGVAEMERQRVNNRRDNWTAEEKLLHNLAENIRSTKRRDKVKEDFFNEHGCTKLELRHKKNGKKFIEDSLLRNGGDYSYHAVEYRGVWYPVSIWCNYHEEFFYQTPKSHSVGSGCNKCGKLSTGTTLRLTQDEFLSRAEAVCEGKYTFDNVVYDNYHKRVSVTCKEHQDFLITPGNLLSGKGCPSCANYGYRPALTGHLYVLTDGQITKIGITNNDVGIRLKQINKSGKNFTVLWSRHFSDGNAPDKLESILLKELREVYKQPGEKFDGSTECFLDVDLAKLLNRISELI